MFQRTLIFCAWIGLLFLAAYLRLHDLQQRPFHADEATGARILSNRLENDTYQFNPQHFHGPLLSLSSESIARLSNETTWKKLTKRTLRLGPAIAGILLVLTPLLWRRQFSPFAALSAAALLATSPLLVYYNRMYIHESLLTLLAMLTLPVAYRLVVKPTLTTATITGIGMGLMFATKETFIISILAWLAATLGFYVTKRGHQSSETDHALPIKNYLLPALVVALTAAALSSFFYSNGFRSLQGIVDAIKTYFVYETTAGHEKPLSYYFNLLIWPKNTVGLWWSEMTIAVLAIASCVMTVRKSKYRGILIYLGIATIAHLIIYSFIGYKTPWLMLVPWAHACLLAGLALRSFTEMSIPLRVASLVILVVGLGYQTKQSLHATGRYASDARNPYAYVPTSKDTEILEKWLSAVIDQQGAQTFNPIAVIGSEYWPLPWYLRQFDTIGYWPQPETTIIDYALVFAMPQQDTATGALLRGSHTALPRSLRAEVPVILYLRNDIWEQWTKPTDE